MAIDFQKMLDDWSGTGVTGGDPIKSIYGIVPVFDGVQLELYCKALYYINKWDLEDMQYLFVSFEQMLRTNKNLDFFGSRVLKDLLSAYTQNELMRGVKVNTYNDTSSNNNNGSTTG